MEDEPRIARQFKFHYCCVCKNFRGKVVEDGRKVSSNRFPADRECVETHFCRDKNVTFVATKIILVAAPANDTFVKVPSLF